MPITDRAKKMEATVRSQKRMLGANRVLKRLRTAFEVLPEAKLGFEKILDQTHAREEWETWCDSFIVDNQ